MNGLLLRLLEDATGGPGFVFWRLFGSIRQDLDRLFWCFVNQPWMGAPEEFRKDETAMIGPLWRPGSLARHAHQFAEEFIELWGIEPTREDPLSVAALFHARPWGDGDRIIRQYARVWLLYTDSSCWEIYAHKNHLLKQVRDDLWGKPWVEVFDSQDDRRSQAFRAAGLGHLLD